jgi:hypothetical protein
MQLRKLSTKRTRKRKSEIYLDNPRLNSIALEELLRTKCLSIKLQNNYYNIQIFEKTSWRLRITWASKYSKWLLVGSSL